VVNTCFKKSFEGKKKVAAGKAWVVDRKTNSKLKVRFFWPFSGDYWIMELGKDYEYAVVGDPKRKYFWILCRTPKMGEDLFKGILERAEEQGYNFDNLIKTPQKEQD
jgi:apolipoprotein D and lipocalin family protein